MKIKNSNFWKKIDRCVRKRPLLATSDQSCEPCAPIASESKTDNTLFPANSHTSAEELLKAIAAMNREAIRKKYLLEISSDFMEPPSWQARQSPQLSLSIPHTSSPSSALGIALDKEPLRLTHGRLPRQVLGCMASPDTQSVLETQGKYRSATRTDRADQLAVCLNRFSVPSANNIKRYCSLQEENNIN